KQVGCKLFRLLRGTTECTDSEGNGQRGSVTIDPAGGRTDDIRSSIRSARNIFKRIVPGVSHGNGNKREELNTINEDELE
ncbi:hypothetical protein HOY82DRAFT_487259, partial [Tuber indicum]